jgi:hypothetical protein
MVWRPSLLCAETIYQSLLDPDGALSVFETPMEWLLEERSGVAIVDPIARCSCPARRRTRAVPIVINVAGLQHRRKLCVTRDRRH